MKQTVLDFQNLILRAVSPAKKKIARRYRRNTTYYGLTVPHLFFHSLSMFPELTFRTDNNPIPGYELYYVTVDEFKAALERLYANGYVLVSIYDAVSGNYALPEGKKPLVLSFDDINYYDFMSGYGFASRMILTKDGRIANEYIDTDGETKVTLEGDSMPIIESFIEAHPDFSYNGARGIIALTGYQGILGYRHPEEQRDELLPLIAALKAKGWLFASHSWGHHRRAYSDNPILTYKGKRDIDRWFREVSPYIGKTDIFISPFGIDTRKNAGFDAYLRRRGFKYFCPISDRSSLSVTHGAYYYLRINVDGAVLSKYPSTLYPFLGHFHPFISKYRKNDYPDMWLTADGLVAFARQCLEMSTVYIPGAKGGKVTEPFMEYILGDFPGEIDDSRLCELKALYDKGYRGFDSCGLLKRYLMGGFGHFSFNAVMNLDTAAMFAASPRKGTVDTLPETPGICLYMEGHTGVYEGNGSVIECTMDPRFGDGVVRTRLSDRPWTHWYALPWVEYGDGLE